MDLNNYWMIFSLPLGYHERSITPWLAKKGMYLCIIQYSGWVAVSSGAENSNYSDFKFELGTPNRYPLNYQNPRFHLTVLLQKQHYHKTVRLDYNLTQPNVNDYKITIEKNNSISISYFLVT